MSMYLFFIISSGLFFLWCIRNISFWLAVWQANGYRPDRFFAYLHTRRQGIPIFLSPLFIIKLLLFLSYVVFIFYDQYLLYYQYAIAAFYVCQATVVIREMYHNTLRKPTLDFRAGLIIFLSLFIIFFLFAFPLLDTFFWLLFIDILLPSVVSFFVFLLLFPAEIYDDLRAEKAFKKIRAHHNLLVIGVTGSVGKSQAKDFIAYILSKKFIVIKTEGKQNTLSGISQTILQKLEKSTEIFVAEMSAYHKGEIAALCQFIRPQIGVLTAINSYYVPLFKNIENIRKTNYELVESLPKNGFCLFNGDNNNSNILYKKSKRKKVLYGFSVNVQAKEKQLVALNLLQKAKRTTFDVKLRGKTVHFVTSTVQPIEYLLPGIFIADYLGMSITQIRKAVAAYS